MSVIGVVPARKLYRCDICGTEGFWSRSWRRYSSVILDETCPDDVPHLCSKECEAASQRKINTGEWVLPKLTRHMSPRVITPGIGYGSKAPAPSQDRET